MHPFGFGANYSEVAYGPVTLSAPTFTPGGSLRVSARVSNVGRWPVAETVQLYVHDHVARISRPVSQLVGVQLVELAPGEAQDVTFELDGDDLVYLDAEGARCSDLGTFTVRIAPHAGGGSTASFVLLEADRADR